MKRKTGQCKAESNDQVDGSWVRPLIRLLYGVRAALEVTHYEGSWWKKHLVYSLPLYPFTFISSSISFPTTFTYFFFSLVLPYIFFDGSFIIIFFTFPYPLQIYRAANFFCIVATTLFSPSSTLLLYFIVHPSISPSSQRHIAAIFLDSSSCSLYSCLLSV